MVDTMSPHRVVVRTTDFDEAVQRMRNAFGPVDFRPDAESDADLSMRSVLTADVQSTRWAMAGIGGAVRDEYDTAEDVYLTGLRLSGVVKAWSRWEEIDTDRPFLYPHLIDSMLEQPAMANLAVSRAVVARHARAITGVDDFHVRFTGTAPIDAAISAVWQDAMAFAARTADALVDLPHTTLAQAGIVELIGGLILRTFPNSTLDATNSRDVLGPRGAPLRRAIRYIEDNLDKPIVIPDIADAARLSTRGLYAAFQRDLSTTPMAYLREARLAAVRDQLREADPLTTAVADVAVRWGFVHSARFVQRYRDAFGERPEETLRR